MLDFLAQSTEAYQRLLLKMAKYNVEMRYIQGKMKIIADALSGVIAWHLLKKTKA